MSSTPNGRNGDHDPSRRLRYDDRFAILERAFARGPRLETARGVRLVVAGAQLLGSPVRDRRRARIAGPLGAPLRRLPRVAEPVPGAGRLRSPAGRAGGQRVPRRHPARCRPHSVARCRDPHPCDARDHHGLEPARTLRDARPPRRARRCRRPREGAPGGRSRRAGRHVGRHVRARRVPPKGHALAHGRASPASRDPPVLRGRSGRPRPRRARRDGSARRAC